MESFHFEELNPEARERNEKDYKKTGSLGFFLLDVYPKEARGVLLAGFKQMLKPDTGTPIDRPETEGIPRLHEEGHLRFSSWVRVGELSGPNKPSSSLAEAVDLPAGFSSVSLDVHQFADFGYLVMYGFILEEDLESDIHQNFLRSDDMIRDTQGETDKPRGYHRRPYTRGRLESLERKAREWISRFVSGTLDKSETCPC